MSCVIVPPLRSASRAERRRKRLGMIRLYHRTYRVRLSVGKFRLQFQLKRQRVSYIATRCILYIGPAITWALYRLLDSRTAGSTRHRPYAPPARER